VKAPRRSSVFAVSRAYRPRTSNRWVIRPSQSALRAILSRRCLVADSDLQTSLTALLTAWAAQLPTIQPTVANAPWLNNKALTFGIPGSPPSSGTNPTSSTNFLTSDRPVWHAGKSFSLPLIGTSAKPITAATVQSGLSGSEYAIGATPSGTPALTHAGPASTATDARRHRGRCRA